MTYAGDAYGVAPYAGGTAGTITPAPTPGVLVDTPRTTSALAIRIGNRHITSEVSALRFRKEAVGGVRNVTLRLARPLDRFDTDLQAYSRVYIYDARSASTIAEARLSDFGRGADAGSGQQWDIVAFGPVQHASDRQFPYIVIDQSLERWSFDRKSVEHATLYVNEVAADGWGHIHKPPTSVTISTSYMSNASYRALVDAGQKLGSLITTWRGGVADADYRAKIVTQTGLSGSENVAYDAALGTGVTNKTVVVVTDFPNADDVAQLRMTRQTSGTTVSGSDWLKWNNLQVRALLLDSDGTEITSGYTSAYVLAAAVIKDLLGRVLDQYDGTNAAIASAAAHQIDQLAYPDGITAAQVLDDLMVLEPAFYWTTGPSNSAGKYSFAWKAWPTTVRYEVTLNDGGSFPASSQELWNRVLVRWKDAAGRVRNTVRTRACAILDGAGVVRQAIIDLGDDTGSLVNAQRAGDNFLASHNVPNNAGNLTVSRPIRDLTTGAMVEPFEIEPGELIRVRGVESYPDALNASSNDGLTVFRIWSMEYDSDSGSATLELDTWSRTEANAISRLITRRNRRR